MLRVMGTTPQTAPTPRSGAHGRTAASAGGASDAAVPDPQTDEDHLVERVRERSGQARRLAATWRRWAASNRAAARAEHVYFNRQLLLARAAVRDEAAALLLTQDPAGAAQLMMQRAAAHVVRNPPLIDYDVAAIHYTEARSWQFCARQIDPSLPEVQPRWP